MEAPSPSFAEFFAGIGLMRLGLERAGWTCAFANDLDPAKRSMYAAHFGEDGHYVLADIHDLEPDAIQDVQLATASFPCTDLSLAGARRGLGGRQSSAYWGFIRLLKGMGKRRPPLVLIENVTGFVSSRGGADFHEAMHALNALGYGVDPVVLNALAFVPQSRSRLFVVAVQGASRCGVARESQLRPPALVDFVRAHRDIRWALNEWPALPASDRRLEDVLEDLPDDSAFWWSRERTDYLFSQMSPRHRALLETMRARPGWSTGAVFRRVRAGRSMAELRTDGIAGCLRTPRGGSARQIIVQAGEGRVRARLLTPRECARLMGAGEFVIETSLNRALFGFGDAVCVPVVEWLARHVLNRLAAMAPAAEASAPGIEAVD
jgi:DNA (cytosine-5)-methyltransferase 1